MVHAPSYALVADLVASRQVKQRQRFADRLKAYVGELATGSWRDEWLAPPAFTKGIDEFSAALVRPRFVFDIATQLNLEIWPLRFRVAVGCGEIDVGADSGDATQMDGSAFHRAARALERARRHKLAFALAAPGCAAEVVAMAESTTTLHAAIVTSWSERSRQTVVAYRATGNQAAAAERLKVSQQAVSQTLRRARQRELSLAEDSLRDWLGSFPTT